MRRFSIGTVKGRPLGCSAFGIVFYNKAVVWARSADPITNDWRYAHFEPVPAVGSCNSGNIGCWVSGFCVPSYVFWRPAWSNPVCAGLRSWTALFFHSQICICDSAADSWRNGKTDISSADVVWAASACSQILINIIICVRVFAWNEGILCLILTGYHYRRINQYRENPFGSRDEALRNGERDYCSIPYRRQRETHFIGVCPRRINSKELFEFEHAFSETVAEANWTVLSLQNFAIGFNKEAVCQRSIGTFHDDIFLQAIAVCCIHEIRIFEQIWISNGVFAVQTVTSDGFVLILCIFHCNNIIRVNRNKWNEVPVIVRRHRGSFPIGEKEAYIVCSVGKPVVQTVSCEVCIDNRIVNLGHFSACVTVEFIFRIDDAFISAVIPQEGAWVGAPEFCKFPHNTRLFGITAWFSWSKRLQSKHRLTKQQNQKEHRQQFLHTHCSLLLP